MDSQEMLHGRCLCGGVVFHAQVDPLAPNFSNSVSHCFCTMCQKFHGAAAGSYIDVPTSGYVVERGADLITEYVSSEQGRRGFCKTCGSSLYWRSTAQPQIIELSLGLMQPPWTGTITREVYVDTKPSWTPHR